MSETDRNAAISDARSAIEKKASEREYYRNSVSSFYAAQFPISLFMKDITT